MGRESSSLNCYSCESRGQMGQSYGENFWQSRSNTLEDGPMVSVTVERFRRKKRTISNHDEISCGR